MPHLLFPLWFCYFYCSRVALRFSQYGLSYPPTKPNLLKLQNSTTGIIRAKSVYLDDPSAGLRRVFPRIPNLNMTLNSAKNTQMFPIARLDRFSWKLPFTTGFQSKKDSELTRVPAHRLVPSVKHLPSFEKGSLIDVYI